MGESREGEGRPAGLPVIQALTDLVNYFNDDTRELATLQVRRLTEGVYSVNIAEHGAEEWETLYVSL